jgi:hypothetical protein
LNDKGWLKFYESNVNENWFFLVSSVEKQSSKLYSKGVYGYAIP